MKFVPWQRLPFVSVFPYTAFPFSFSEKSPLSPSVRLSSLALYVSYPTFTLSSAPFHHPLLLHFASSPFSSVPLVYARVFVSAFAFSTYLNFFVCVFVCLTLSLFRRKHLIFSFSNRPLASLPLFTCACLSLFPPSQALEGSLIPAFRPPSSFLFFLLLLHFHFLGCLLPFYFCCISLFLSL